MKRSRLYLPVSPLLRPLRDFLRVLIGSRSFCTAHFFMPARKHLLRRQCLWIFWMRNLWSPWLSTSVTSIAIPVMEFELYKIREIFVWKSPNIPKWNYWILRIGVVGEVLKSAFQSQFFFPFNKYQFRSKFLNQFIPKMMPNIWHIPNIPILKIQ